MQNFRSRVPSNLLSFEELEKAELEMIHLCQKKRYSEELVSLRKDGVVKRSSQLYRLNPVLQSDIIRVGGGLDKAMMPEEVTSSNTGLEFTHFRSDSASNSS